MDGALLNDVQIFWLFIGGLGALVCGGLLVAYLFTRDHDVPLPGRNALYHTTVLVVIFAVMLLTLAGTVRGDAAIAVLSGIVGFVLGSFAKLPSQ